LKLVGYGAQERIAFHELTDNHNIKFLPQ